MITMFLFTIFLTKNQSGKIECLNTEITRVFYFLLSLIVLFFPQPVKGELDALETDELRDVQGRQGINLQVDLNATADYLELRDDNGTSLGPASENPGALRLGDFSLDNGGSGNFTTMSLDVDGNNGVVFSIPSSDANFNFDVSTLTIPDDPSSSSLDGNYNAGGLDVGDIDITGSDLEITGRDEGISVDGTIVLNADYFRYDDGDGGSGQLLFVSPSLETGGSYNFSGVTLDFDENGVVFQPPTSPFTLTSSAACVVDSNNNTCNYSPFAENLRLDDFELLGSSTLVISGTGSGSNGDNGLMFDGQIGFEADYIQLEDCTGTPQKSATSCSDSNAGTVNFSDIRFTDASSGIGNSGGGNPVSFNSPAELHVDGEEGLFLQLPGFDTSGTSFGSPANELYIENMNVGEGTYCSTCGDWSVRNIDTSGSWVNLQGRN